MPDSIDLVHRRCLLKINAGRWESTAVEEYYVLEISPSHNFLKLQNVHGNKFWKAIAEVSFVEFLHDLKAQRRAETKEANGANP